jgi:hypothetical protein
MLNQRLELLHANVTSAVEAVQARVTSVEEGARTRQRVLEDLSDVVKAHRELSFVLRVVRYTFVPDYEGRFKTG